MSGFIGGLERNQITLFPEQLEDWICEDNRKRFAAPTYLA